MFFFFLMIRRPPRSTLTDTLLPYRLSSGLVGQDVTEVGIVGGELSLHCRTSSAIKVLTFLRDDSQCQFKGLMDVTAVDYPQREQRFEVVYNLLSIRQNSRIRLKVPTDENNPGPSAIGLFRTDGERERGTWGMYGLYFSGTPDRRRQPPHN